MLGFHLINLRLAGFWEGAEVLAIAVGHQPHYGVATEYAPLKCSGLRYAVATFAVAAEAANLHCRRFN